MKYTIQPYYIEALKKLREAVDNDAGGIMGWSSVEGLIEQAISTYLYEGQVALDITPRQLPVAEINGKRYYHDDRLSEFRSIEKFPDEITWIRY